MPFTPDQPFPKAQGSTIRSKDWNDLVTETQRLDTAKVNRAGDTLTGPLAITGGVWDLTNSEGDFKIGNAATRLKVGVALGGGGAGDVRIRAQGGTNRLLLGGGTNDVLSITPDTVGVTGDLRVADHTLWLRADTNHGLGWYGPGRAFAGQGVDGPVLFGFSGGALGTNQNGTQLLALTWDPAGNVAVGSPTVAALRLSVTAPGVGPLGGTARSQTLATNAGVLGATQGNELALTSIGFTSGNSSSLGIRALRVSNGNQWTSAAIGLGMDVDNTVRVNASGLWFSASGNVGVATATPTERLEVSGNLKINGSRLINAQGYGMLQTDATDWLRVNPDEKYPATAVYKSMALGTGGLAVGDWSQQGLGNLWVTNQATIGAAIQLNDPSIGGHYLSIHFESGNGTVVFYHQNGAGQFMRQDGVWQHNSDASLKENVVGLTGVLDKVLQLRPVTFDWKGSGLRGLGFVAQEVDPVFPELVAEHTGPDGRPLKGLPYASFGVLAIGALQELKRHYDARIEALEAQVRSLTPRS